MSGPESGTGPAPDRRRSTSAGRAGVGPSREQFDGIPPGSLVVLVGPAGSGKSTWAAWHCEPGDVLSSDAFRELVSGDAADQAATADAFKALHLVLRARLRRGLRTVVDATNLTVAARRSLLRVAGAAARPVVAVAFDVPLERCLELNRRREARRVPDDVVRRHYAQMRQTLATLPREGYERIVTVRGEEEAGRDEVPDDEGAPGRVGAPGRDPAAGPLR